MTSGLGNTRRIEAATFTRASPSAAARALRSAPDDRLVSRLRAGDERSFEVIYDRYHLPLLSFCRHMLGTREEAEDALQQVFVSAHGQLVRDAREVQLRPWLYAIARNRCLSMLRARRETVALDDVTEPTGAGLAVAAQVQQRQDLKDILGDLARLPDQQRAALVLAELDDLTHEEIGLALEVPRDKVKALIFQAREALLGFRVARDADCAPIREQLATLRGGALRRGSLARHVAICPGCAAFKAEVKRQRTVLGAVMPVVPALALKDHILGAVQTASAASGAAGGAGVVALTASSGAAGGAGTAGSAGLGAGTAGGVAATSGAAGSLAAAGGTGLLVKGLAIAAVTASAGGGAVAIRSAVDDPPAKAPVVRTITSSTSTPFPVGGPPSATPSGVTPADPSAAARGRGRTGGGEAAATSKGKGAAAKGQTPGSGAGRGAANGNAAGAKASAGGQAFGKGHAAGARRGTTKRATPAAPKRRSTVRKKAVRTTTKRRTAVVPTKPVKPVRTTSTPPTATAGTPAPVPDTTAVAPG